MMSENSVRDYLSYLRSLEVQERVAHLGKDSVIGLKLSGGELVFDG
jgi:hypothetical protein